jgi:hypothetical protein
MGDGKKIMHQTQEVVRMKWNGMKNLMIEMRNRARNEMK